LSISKATLAIRPFTFVFDTDSIEIRIDTTLLNDGSSGRWSSRGLDTLAPSGFSERNQLRDFTLLRDDKVARSRRSRVAQPRDSTSISTFSDVANNYIRLPRTTRSLVRRRLLGDREAQLRRASRSRGRSRIVARTAAAARRLSGGQVLVTAIIAIIKLSPAIRGRDDTKRSTFANGFNFTIVSTRTSTDVQVGSSVLGSARRSSRSRRSSAATRRLGDIGSGAVVTSVKLSPAISDGDNTNSSTLVDSLSNVIVSARTSTEVQGSSSSVVNARDARRSRLARIFTIAITGTLGLARTAIVGTLSAVTPIRAAVATRATSLLTVLSSNAS